MRITGGELRGRRLAVPPHDFRPTSERARQAFFNIVQQRVEGSKFLDLFAGSGVFSLEAVSRGAQSAVAVEKSPEAANALKAIAQKWAVPVQVINADVFTALKQLGKKKFDLIYADPPYDFQRYAQLLNGLDRAALLEPDGVVAFEHRSSVTPFPGESPRGLELWKTVRYGEVSITLFEARNGPQE